MKHNWRNLLLVATLGIGASAMTSGCVVRAQVVPANVVTSRPPAPRYVTPQARTGHVWVKGRWQWQNNNWAWKTGHHVRVRTGQSYVAGRWEQRGNRWHWVDGRWNVSAGGRADVRDHRRPVTPPRRVDVRDHRQPVPVVRAYPISAPPVARYQTPAARVGFVWISGRHQWRNGAYVWTVGRWEKARAQKVWVRGSWKMQNGRYVWQAGVWQAAPRRVDVRDHRTNPGRRNEVVPARRGQPR